MNQSTKWCDYETGYAGLCGGVALFGTRCKRHKNMPQRKKRIKSTPYSGDSKYREDMGQFQAKEGR